MSAAKRSVTMRCSVESKRHLVIEYDTGAVFDVVPEPTDGSESYFMSIGRVRPETLAAIEAEALASLTPPQRTIAKHDQRAHGTRARSGK